MTTSCLSMTTSCLLMITSCPQCVELYAPALRWAEVVGCTVGGRGGQLMRSHAARTRGLKPPHRPWVSFNGVSLL